MLPFSLSPDSFSLASFYPNSAPLMKCSSSSSIPSTGAPTAPPAAPHPAPPPPASGMALTSESLGTPPISKQRHSTPGAYYGASSSLSNASLGNVSLGNSSLSNASLSNASLAYNSILEPLFIPQVTNLVVEPPNATAAATAAAAAAGEELLHLQQLKKVKLSKLPI